MDHTGDAPSDAAQQDAADATEADSYWGDRLGGTPRHEAGAPRPGARASAAGDAPGAPAQTPPHPPPIARQRVAPASPPPYGAAVYRPPNVGKNWIIGIGAALVLAAATIVPILLISSTTQSVIHTALALPSSGSDTVAWYWGGNPFAGTNSATPLNIPTNQKFATITSSRTADSFAYFVALDRHGTAYEWGTPSLLNSPLAITMQPTPVKMPPGIRFTSVSTNQGYVLALDQAGHLWEWGNLSRDRPNTSTSTSTNPSAPAPTQSPVAVPTPTGTTFRAISAGWNFSLALDSTGRAWSWGENTSYDLGLQTNQTPVSAPTPVDTPAGVTFTAIAAGLAHAVALDSSGRAWSWGDNAFGELGVNASALTAGSCAQRADCSATPVLANLPANVHLTAIAAGEDYTAAVDAGGHVWAWGTNAHGALGLAGAATTCATATACTVNGPPQPTNSVPAEVSAPAGVHFVAVAVTQGDQSGDDATIALDGHGQAWAWGANLILQFSAGRQPCFSPENLPQNSATGVELCMLTPAKLNMPAGATFEKIAASTDVLFGFPR